MLERLLNFVKNDDDFGFIMPILGNFGFDFETKGLLDCLKLNGTEHFTLKNGIYEFSMDVDENANSDNVKIDLDKNNLMKVKYSRKTDYSERIVIVKESVPEDADSDTLDAKISNGKLIVTVSKK